MNVGLYEEQHVHCQNKSAIPGAIIGDDQPRFPRSFFQESEWRISDFDHFKEIGKGKDTTIYSAICHRLSDQLVAVKVYDKSRVSTTKFRAIKREIAMMMFFERLKFPNVVKYYSAFEDGYCYYIVMELCSGGDLLELLLREKKFFTERRASIEIMMPLLTCLAYLHSQKIIHRDIKLENIFLDSHGRVKLGDFGLTMCMHQEAAISPVGTTEYMAPEVVALPSVEEVTSGKIRASSINPTNEKVDIWALGITLYELVTGKLPFEGKNKLEVKNAIREYRLTPFPSHVSTHCQSMIRAMLAYDPDSRPSAEQLLQHPFMQIHRRNNLSHFGLTRPQVTLDVRAGPALPQRTPSAASYNNVMSASHKSLSPCSSMNLNCFQESAREFSMNNMSKSFASQDSLTMTDKDFSEAGVNGTQDHLTTTLGYCTNGINHHSPTPLYTKDTMRFSRDLSGCKPPVLLSMVDPHTPIRIKDHSTRAINQPAPKMDYMDTINKRTVRSVIRRLFSRQSPQHEK